MKSSSISITTASSSTCNVQPRWLSMLAFRVAAADPLAELKRGSDPSC